MQQRKAHEGHHKRQGVSNGRKDEQVEWPGKPSKKQHAGNLVKKREVRKQVAKGREKDCQKIEEKTGDRKLGM
jgi:hypothetical protein